MLKQILVGIFAFSLIALIALWVITGGPRQLVTDTTESIRAAVTTDKDVGFQLPWQPAQIFPTIDITDLYDFSAEEERAYSAYADYPEYPDYPDFAPTHAQQLAELESEYDRLRAEASRQRTFGAPSPYAGKVAIQSDISGVRASDPREEYLQIVANYANSETIDISGWILESALSGTRILIPPAASPFIANSSNSVGSVLLEPGGLALVTSAVSPVGVSFRENMCTGYLGQFQDFGLPLSEECPSPAQVLPLTEENLRLYGDACFDAIMHLPVCRFPQNLPSSVSSACRAYLTDALSYNGCVKQNRFRSAFNKNMWRIYLGSPKELWRNSHDAVRLLDAQGRTVSVYVY
ncbi:MAG TPA: hypothetical protein VNM40_03960 [Candidatus Paceibacterota bacterium]|nr:hypothetical protein [Candidatus Paceibacterota bacterium]